MNATLFPCGKFAYLLAVIGFLAVAIPRLTAQQASPAKVDTILHNGKILTVDAQFSMAQAVAIGGQKIVAVGDDQKILAMAGPNTLKIDLKGRTVIPGLIDTHDHIHDQAQGAYGGNMGPDKLKRYPVDWRGVTNKDDPSHPAATFLMRLNLSWSCLGVHRVF